MLLAFLVSGVFAQTVTPVIGIKTDKKIIAYTFDDGPYSELTEQILEYLKSENVVATFFNMGKHMMELPELTRKILDYGNELGNHTINHLKLNEIKDEKIIRCEIDEFQNYAKEKFNYTPTSFRAPFLKYDERVFDVLTENHLIPVNASVYAKDAKPVVSPDSIIARVLKNVKPGAIILSHERKHTLIALRTIIPELKKRGYKFATVSELLKMDEK